MIFIAPTDSNPNNFQLTVVLDEPGNLPQARLVKVFADDCGDTEVAECVTDWLLG
jgi:hypothetical protein